MSKSHFWRAGHSFNLGLGRPKALIPQLCSHGFPLRYARIFKSLSVSFQCSLHYISFPLGGARILHWFCSLLGQKHFHLGNVAPICLAWPACFASDVLLSSQGTCAVPYSPPRLSKGMTRLCAEKGSFVCVCLCRTHWYLCSEVFLHFALQKNIVCHNPGEGRRVGMEEETC